MTQPKLERGQLFVALRAGLDAALEKLTQVLPSALRLVELLELAAGIALLDAVFVDDAFKGVDCLVAVVER